MTQTGRWFLGSPDPSRPRRGRVRALRVAASITLAGAGVRCADTVRANPKGCRYADPDYGGCSEGEPDASVAPDAGARD